MHHGSDAPRIDAGRSLGSAVARQVVPVLLVATAIFLIVLILARSPLQGFVISQRVHSAADRATTIEPLATEQVVSWLKTDAVLAAAVQQVCPRDSLAAQQDLIQEMHRCLDVQADAARATQFGWNLTLQHRDRHLASRLLNAMSESLKAQLKHLDQAETQLLVQHYQKALLQARDDEDSARQALEHARHEQLSVAMQSSPDPLPSLVPALPPVSRSRVNPVWQELQQKVLAAKSRLEQLLTARTPAHPHVIEAQSQVTQLEELLSRTPRESGAELPKATSPAPELQGPQLREAEQARSRLPVRQVSSTEGVSENGVANAAGNLELLTSRWSTATSKRAAVERSWNEAQQQWVRGLNAEGWVATPVWTQSQIGGRVTSYQILLAAALAGCAGLGTWRLTYLATRDGALSSRDQLADALPLPVLGAVLLTTDFPKRLPERMNTRVLRLTQVSLAAIAAVVLVIAWANSIDTNLNAQWASDPLSALGQSFDLLHSRFLG